MMNDLLPCPFCNTSDNLAETTDETYDTYTVTCWKCGFDGPSGSTRKEANERWNNRKKKKSKKVVSYRLIRLECVNERLKDGWSLYGNPFVSGVGDININQAMVKYEDE